MKDSKKKVCRDNLLHDFQNVAVSLKKTMQFLDLLRQELSKLGKDISQIVDECNGEKEDDLE